MASNYGPHFGVRRWDEDMAYREGRLKTPTTGSKLLIGTAVGFDWATPGFMLQCAADAPLVPGTTGLLIYEDQFLDQLGLDVPRRRDITDLAYVPLGKYAVLGGGRATKFWYKNIAASTGQDAHSYPAITVVDGLGDGDVVPGDWLGWDGTKFAVVGHAADAMPDTAWFQVTTVNDAAASLEAVLVH